MSLLNTVAAAPESEICAFARDSSHVVVATAVGRISSFGIGGWSDPLGLLLNEVMLGGSVVSASLSHDRDVPRWFDVERTRSLARRIDEAFAKADPPSTDPNSYDDWIRSELSRAHAVVTAAARAGECVITAWEVIGAVNGDALRIRERRPGEPPPLPPLRLPPPLVIAGCIAGGILAGALWRQRRMSRRLSRG